MREVTLNTNKAIGRVAAKNMVGKLKRDKLITSASQVKVQQRPGGGAKVVISGGTQAVRKAVGKVQNELQINDPTRKFTRPRYTTAVPQVPSANQPVRINEIKPQSPGTPAAGVGGNNIKPVLPGQLPKSNVPNVIIDRGKIGQNLVNVNKLPGVAPRPTVEVAARKTGEQGLGTAAVEVENSLPQNATLPEQTVPIATPTVAPEQAPQVPVVPAVETPAENIAPVENVPPAESAPPTPSAPPEDLEI